VGDSVVLVSIKQEKDGFNGVIKLNETAAFVAELLKQKCSYSDLQDALLQNYSVSSEEAGQALDYIISQFESVGAIDRIEE
jgi:hypothetical protein